MNSDNPIPTTTMTPPLDFVIRDDTVDDVEREIVRPPLSSSSSEKEDGCGWSDLPIVMESVHDERLVTARQEDDDFDMDVLWDENDTDDYTTTRDADASSLLTIVPSPALVVGRSFNWSDFPVVGCQHPDHDHDEYGPKGSDTPTLVTATASESDSLAPPAHDEEEEGGHESDDCYVTMLSC